MFTIPKSLRFLWNACWRERGALGRAVQISVVTIPALAALMIQGWSRSDWPWWVWLVIIANSLLIAIFIGFFRRFYELELEREPKVKITGPTAMTYPKGIAGKAARTLRIEIENESILHLKNCSVRELTFVNRHGNESGLQRYFRLAEEGYAHSAHTFKKTFDLRGKGAREIIEIAHLDETRDDSRIVMLYATEPTAPVLNAIPRDFFPHTLTISFTADNIPIPETRIYKLSVSGEGILEMTRKGNHKNVTRKTSQPRRGSREPPDRPLLQGTPIYRGQGCL
jgi:hypothetical protein